MREARCNRHEPNIRDEADSPGKRAWEESKARSYSFRQSADRPASISTQPRSRLSQKFPCKKPGRRETTKACAEEVETETEAACCRWRRIEKVDIVVEVAVS